MPANDLSQAVLTILKASKSPLHRGDICSRLRISHPHLQRCAISTVERRVKEAINVLIRDGHPIVSDGRDGFRIATTKAERDEAATRLRKAGIAVMVRASRLQDIPLEQTMHQAALEFGGGQ